ncbi:MAG: glycerophosphodiester phosphodiesterase family protein [Oscillospiraceae bacterium]
MKKQILSLLIAVVMLFSFNMFAFAAEAEKTPTFDALKKADGRLLAVSKYGDKKNYPENSIEGIMSSAEKGADMVMVSVKMTADKQLVLFNDDNLSRMCVDSIGNVATKNINEVGYKELSTYHLRKSSGLLHQEITEYIIPTLREAVEKLNEKTILVLQNSWNYKDEIYKILSETGTLSNVIIMTDANKKDVSSWIKSKDNLPLVMSSYSGNIIWSAKSYISKTLDSGAACVLLSSSNPYSVLYGKSVISKFENSGRAAIDMTDASLCGKREDNYVGWNDVTARGYSIIITDDVEGLNDYYSHVEKQRTALEVAVKSAESVNYALCSTNSSNDLKDAVIEAKKVLATSNSEDELMQSTYKLGQSTKLLSNRTDEVKEGTTITKGRIIAVVLVVIGLIIAEICFEYFRRKKIQKRRAAQRKAEIDRKRDN